MLTNVVNIDFADFTERASLLYLYRSNAVFYSISEGIAMGVITYVVINLVAGKAKEKKMSLLMIILAVLFVGKYFLL